MWKYVQDVNTTPEQVAAWFPDERKWKLKDLYEDGSDHLLMVFFMDDCPKEWNKVVTPLNILSTLNRTWKRCFFIGEINKAHIRVTFRGMSINYPIGTIT